MMEIIENELECLDSKHPIDQYNTVVKLANQIYLMCQQDRSDSNIFLAQKIKDKVHRVRYVIAYNKATDIGTLDVELGKLWRRLSDLIDTDKYPR